MTRPPRPSRLSTTSRTPSETEEPPSASQSAPPYYFDDNHYMLETSRDRAKWFFLRLFIWISIGEITVGFILSVFGVQQYATRGVSTTGQRVYLSVGVSLMFIGLACFIVCLTLWRMSKTRRRPRGPRLIPVQVSDVFSLREAPPSYTLPGTSYLPVDQPPPAYDEALNDSQPEMGFSNRRSYSNPSGVATEQRLNAGFTMDEVPVEDISHDLVTRRPRSSVIQQLRRHVTSVGSQTDEILFV